MAMLVEMLLLAVFARSLYSKDIPDLTEDHAEHQHQHTQVCVIEVTAQKSDLSLSPIKESNNNNNSIGDDTKVSYKF